MASLGELVVRIETDLTNFNRGLSDANSRMQKTRGAIVQGTQQIGRAFTVMGAVIVGTFGLASKAAISFEDAFAGVRKTVDLTEEGFTELRQNFRDLSKEIPITANALAKIGEVVGQLGVTGVDDITKFTETIAKLGLTTNIVGEQGALQLSRFINIIGESTKNVDRLGAVIVDLGNNFAAREAEILDLSLSLASFGRQIGLSSDQVIAFATIIKASGGEAQAASSAFQKIALKLKDAVIVGGESLEKFAEIAGVSVESLSKTFKEDAAEAMVIFLEGLRDIEEQGGSTSQALAELGLADIRLIRELGKVIGSTDKLREALDLAKKAYEENTALTEEFEKKMKATASQLKLLRNVVVDVAITIGDVLIPRIKRAIEFIKPIIENIGQWVSKNQKLADIIIITTAAIGGLMLALGPLLIILPPIIISVLALGTAGFTLAGTLAVLTAILLPLAAIAAGAFAGWKLAERLRDVFNLDDALSGPDGLFTKMFIKIDEAKEKLDIFFRKIRGFAELIRGTLFGPRGVAPDVAKEEVAVGEEAGTAKTREELSKQKELKDKASKEDEKREKTSAKKTAETRKLNREDFNADLQAGITSLGSSLAQASELNKGFAIAAAAIALGLAIANTAQGITKAFADHPWPFSAVVAGLIGAAGAIQVATIAATQFQTGTDTVPALLTPGEIVVPRPFSDAIRAGDIVIGGPGSEAGGKQVIINAPVEITVAGVLDESLIDTLTEMVGENIEEKLRRVVI